MAASWYVFLPTWMIFACLFLILRQDVFAYLLTLSLSLLAYDWVRASSSMFTQDILFYVVIAGVVNPPTEVAIFTIRSSGPSGSCWPAPFRKPKETEAPRSAHWE